MIQAGAKLTGIKELRRALRAVGPDESFADIRASLRAGMKSVLQDTRASVRASSVSGAWLASLGLSTASKARVRNGREGRGIVGRASVVANGRKKKALSLWNTYQMAQGKKQGYPARGLFHFMIVDEYGFKGIPPKRIMSRALTANSFFAPEKFAAALRRRLEKRFEKAART